MHYLLKGAQSISIVLAKWLKQKIEPEFKEPLEQGRILIITPFESSFTRVSKQTALLRNQFITELVDDVVIGYFKEGGSLYKSLAYINAKHRIFFL